MNRPSIILPTYNGAAHLRGVLESVCAQSVAPYEILVIDSESTDDTLDLLARFPVQLHQIPNREFSHSATRNLGARLARGSQAVFLTQDATPLDASWLEHLLRALSEVPDAAGAYSRQVPRPGSDPLEANDLRIGFPTKGRVSRHPGDAETFRRQVWRLVHFSDVSAAYDLALLRQHPFDERLAMGEDQEWALRMLEQGRAIVYEPRSRVWHSHRHGLREKYARNYAMGVAFAAFLGPLLGARRFPLAAYAYSVLSDAAYAPRSDASFRARLAAIARSPLHRFVLHWAYTRGWRDGRARGSRASA